VHEALQVKRTTGRDALTGALAGTAARGLRTAGPLGAAAAATAAALPSGPTGRGLPRTARGPAGTTSALGARAGVAGALGAGLGTSTPAGLPAAGPLTQTPLLPDQVPEPAACAEPGQQLLEEHAEGESAQDEIGEQPSEQAPEEGAEQRGPPLGGGERLAQHVGEAARGPAPAAEQVPQHPLRHPRHVREELAGARPGAAEAVGARGGLLLLGVLGEASCLLAQLEAAVLETGAHAPGPVGAEPLGVLPNPLDGVDHRGEPPLELVEQLRAPGADRAHRPQGLGV